MLTIVIPNFNRFDQIFSLIKIYNEYQFIQKIIIVDDNSFTKERYANIDIQYPKISIILNNQNKGPALRRNQGLLLASDFVVFLDSDDFLEPDWLRIATKKLQDHPNLDYVYSTSNLITNIPYLMYNEENFYNFFRRVNSNLIPLALCVFRRDSLLNNSVFFPTMMRNSEDTIFKLKLLKNKLVGLEVNTINLNPLQLGLVDDFSITKNWERDIANRYYKFLCGLRASLYCVSFRLSFTALTYSYYNLLKILKIYFKS
jgi:glycosyltransferase involved in cell wall biosynthesis